MPTQDQAFHPPVRQVHALDRLDARTTRGALRREMYKSLIVAATAITTLFTLIAHVLTVTPDALVLHGMTGALSGYFFGSGLARMATGLEFRLREWRFVPIGSFARIFRPLLRFGGGVIWLLISYAFAVGTFPL